MERMFCFENLSRAHFTESSMNLKLKLKFGLKTFPSYDSVEANDTKEEDTEFPLNAVLLYLLQTEFGDKNSV